MRALSSVIISIAVCLSLPSCMTKQEIEARNAEQQDATCQSWGLQRGSNAYVQCRTTLLEKEQREADRHQANSQAMMQAGVTMMNQPPPPRPVQTICNPPMGPNMPVTCTTQ